MNIWICNPFDNLVEEGVRPQRYAMLSSELARRGHAVTWWTSDFSHPRKARRSKPDGTPLERAYVNADGVSMRLLPTRPYARNVSLRRVRSHKAFAREWLRQATVLTREGELPRPDLIVTSLPPISTPTAAVAMREAFGCRLAIDIQDAWPEAFEGVLPFPAPLRRPFARLLFGGARKAVRKAFLAADKITAVSQAYLRAPEDATEDSDTPPKMASFRLGISETVETLEPVAEGPLRLVYGGTMGASYDLKTLVKAVARVESMQPGTAHLDLAGTGPEEKTLRQMAAGCRAIAFHGFLRQDEYAALLRRSEVGVIPMFGRSCVTVPNKFADYAAAGLAILSCLPGETEELVEDIGTGATYCAGEYTDLADAILALSVDRKALMLTRQRALDLAKSEFLAPRIYPAMCDFLLS